MIPYVHKKITSLIASNREKCLFLSTEKNRKESLRPCFAHFLYFGLSKALYHCNISKLLTFFGAIYTEIIYTRKPIFSYFASFSHKRSPLLTILDRRYNILYIYYTVKINIFQLKCSKRSIYRSLYR